MVVGVAGLDTAALAAAAAVSAACPLPGLAAWVVDVDVSVTPIVTAAALVAGWAGAGCTVFGGVEMYVSASGAATVLAAGPRFC